VLLDLMLPGRDGIDICRAIRAESGTPIVMLTAKSDTVDVVVGLESGADDYIVKPFKPKELVARIRARMRRTDDVSTSSLAIGDLDIDVIGHTVRRGEQVLSLTPLEFDLLVCLARKPGQVFTRETLLQDVWGYRHSADTRLVNVHVQRLRAKIEHDPENPDIVLTVRGIGYKFLSAGEAVEAYVSEAGKGIKQIARSAMDIASVPRERLDNHQCGRADAAQSLLAKISMDLRLASKALDAKPSSAAQVAPNILGNLRNNTWISI
jgi:two-component system response regulator MtrA